MNGRTYDRPGDCPKCGSSAPRVRWVPSSYDLIVGNRSEGSLMAECKWCGYSWRLTALDELPTAVQAMTGQINRLAGS